LTAAASVFVYGFQITDACRNLLRDLTGDTEADIRGADARPMTVTVTDTFPEMCGPMSGVQIQLEPGAAHAVLSIQRGCKLQRIIGAPEWHLFVGFAHAGVLFFADASQTMVCIHERSATYFDVRNSFAGAVPLVMYLKWSFRDICWTTQETSACLIIDDPLLKPRYGFLEFQELLQLINEQTFATTIAFIPWNWRRTTSSTVAMFEQNSEKLSICVHGCDHTRGEFATRSTDLLERKLKTAKHRMQSLLNRTGLHHDQVMVFPHGAFSPQAGLALKSNSFAAAVNTEVAPADNASNETTVADLWSIAILRYGGFPIFTRRYIHHGIENFAFDGLLGKPCFLVGHHDLFRGHANELTEFLRQLKSLNWNICWRTLGNAVCRSYSIQRREGTIRVKMFAERLIIENKGAVPQQMLILKEEASIVSLKSVTFNQNAVDYEYINGCLQFVVVLPPNTTAEIGCAYHENATPIPSSEPTSYKLKVAAQRYLSELRDNYGGPRSISLLRYADSALRRWLLFPSR
jgi:hypothetical protein